jgi:hypothetical protein
MTDTPEDWVLLEAAKRGRYHWTGLTIGELREQYCDGDADDLYAALCDMIAKHEQKPVDRKLLCAREAMREQRPDDWPETACVHAIELWEEGFGK